jgi:trehalose utilization protein
VEDYVVDRIYKRVMDGMGLIMLHSGHASKIFSKLLGTHTEMLRWRHGDMEKVWKIAHNHPITVNVPECIEIPKSEMYGEYFGIPAPDELLFISWFEGGEVFRSGCTYKRGAGRIFFFSPGHEEYRIYDMPDIQQVILNGIHWAKPLDEKSVYCMHKPVGAQRQ